MTTTTCGRWPTMRKPEQVRQSVLAKFKEHGKGIVLLHDFRHAMAVENLGHDAASFPLMTGRLPCTTRLMRSTRSAARNVSLTSTVCTPEFNLSRSFASRSRAVMTTTGISRHATSFCNAATTAQPSISGIIRSSKITSGLFCRRRSSASRPFVASRTLHCGPASQPRSLALQSVVLHYQHTRGWCSCPKAANQLVKPLAVDRLAQIADRAKCDAASLLIDDCDHDNRDVGELGILPQRRQYRPAIEVRHHDIECDHSRPQLLSKLKPLHATRGGHDGKAFCPEMFRYQLARGHIIVNDENAIDIRRTTGA